MKISFKNIAKRINGISTPVFGVSWNPSESDREKARKLIIYLEDKRALFYAFRMEIPYHVKQSLLDIRKYLTELLQQLDEDSELTSNIKTMRAACRKYLDINPTGKKKRKLFERDEVTALGELRGVFGINLAEICVKYGINIGEELAGILPIEDVD